MRYIPGMPRFMAVIIAIWALAGAATGKLPPVAAEAFARGNQALADRLPDLAAKRFREALKTPDLTDTDRRALSLKLAEALTRSARPEDALKVLADPTLADSAPAQFWRGLALAGLGRYAEAAKTLETPAKKPSAPFHPEAAFTRAMLLAAIGNTTAARKTLEPLTKKSARPETAQRARLELAELAFDHRDYTDARTWLDAIGDPEKSLAKLPGLAARARLLDARLLLRQDHPVEAAERFAALEAAPEGQSRLQHQRAILGHAAALAASGHPDTAADVLIRFISENPASPLLGDAFDEFLDLLPEHPAPADPILAQIEKWISPSQPDSRPLILAADGAPAAWPTAQPDDPRATLSAFALYNLARALRRTDTPEAHARAFQLLRQLRAEFPEHPLARRSLLDAGKWHLDDGHPDRARDCLAALSIIARDPRIAALAELLRGTSDAESGDLKAAAEAFDAAAKGLDGEAAEIAAIDAGVARLRSGNTTISEVPATATNRRVATELALERALLLASNADPAARALLERFIAEHPDHPRLAEARLALANAAMSGAKPDLELAAAQLGTLAAQPEAPNVPPGTLALARTRLAELNNDTKSAAQIARDFIAAHPDDPAAPNLSLRLGQALFRLGDFNEARLVLERLAEADPASPAAEAALFLAARSASLGATSQARAESLELYQKVIAVNGTLADSARIERSRTLIDMGRLDEAIKELRGWSSLLPPDSPVSFAAGALLAEAKFAKGGNDPAAYEQALAAYQDLVKRSAPESAMNHRFRYLLGLTLERLEHPGQALDTYYSLLEATEGHPPLEWEWVERAGFRALAILENAERWAAATAIATRIAKLGGPRAKEAADRARKLRLEHMIWEDQN
jgi:tetratricopeptide (TPR) repeat protein